MNILKLKIFHRIDEVPQNISIIETMEGALRELFFIRNPRLKKEMPEAKKPLAEFLRKNKDTVRGVWVYYPWLGKAAHCPEQDIFFEIKTARNKNLITDKEQKNYRNFKIGIMGMSVGSNVIWPLVASGGPQFLRIADADIIEISNLNRMLGSLAAVGENKAVFMAKKIYEMDPFMKVDCWTEYVSKNNIEKFISGLDLLVDEIDNLSLKFLSRELAKKQKMPVLMVTNVGSNVILDIERFDLEPKRPIFHGLLKALKIDELSHIPYRDWVKIATKIVGPKYLSKRMRHSVKAIGKTIAAVPQISPTTLIAGSVATQAIIRLAAKEILKSGRYFFKIDSHFRA